MSNKTLYASDLYYEDGTATDLYSAVFTDDGCAGCHEGVALEACSGTAIQSFYLGNTTVIAAYPTVAACIGNITDKVSVAPSYGVRMPLGCTNGVDCVSASHLTALADVGD